MKTHEQIKELNCNDIAFFTGKSVVDCKWDIAAIIGAKIDEKKNKPIVTQKDMVSVDKIDFKMRANSALDGKSKFEYLCDYYNKGCDNTILKFYSEQGSFINAIAFTGKYSILNEIMNPEQLLKLQKTWLFSHAYKNRYFNKKAIAFVKKNDWSKTYLEERGILVDKKMPVEI